MSLRTTFALLSVLALGGMVGCTADATPVPVRALSSAGRSAFVCLGAPDDARPERPLSECNRLSTETSDDYGVRAGGGGAGGAGGGGAGGAGGGSGGDQGDSSKPHLYALVTQTTRGEVAVVDLTTRSTALVDQNPATPGANFLPIGALPTDIVATPGGTAAFVAVADVGRAGIFALPTARILRPAPGGTVAACGDIAGGKDCAPPELSTWPSCSLDAAPGEMILVSDPADASGNERPSCDAPYGDAPVADGKPDLTLERRGRQKLLVTLPDRGEIAVIDAQTLLESAPGEFGRCAIERTVKLGVDFPIEDPDPPAPDPGAGADEPLSACLSVETKAPKLPVPLTARPSGVALGGDQLFVGDLSAPLIHVVSLADVCAPKEETPLVPTSLTEPDRVVTTARIAVTEPVTTAFRRYLYAVDAGDGSVMVFDATKGATDRKPLRRPHPEWNPFQSADRIRAPAPVRDVAILQRDVALASQAGVAPEGVRCEAFPRKACCDVPPDQAPAYCAATESKEDERALCIASSGYKYQTSPDFDAGAGPLKLRGTFAYLLLTNGKVEVIDIDDLDDACRGPSTPTAAAGCEGAANQQGASGEVSCSAVLPNAPRATTYIYSSNATGRFEPGVQSFPVLYDLNGTILTASETAPRMRATLPAVGTADGALRLSVGGDPVALRGDGEQHDSAAAGLANASDGSSNELADALAMNLEDPRVHIVDQGWSVVYQGALPGFGDSRADFEVGATEVLISDSDARFCGRGVQSKASVVAQLGDGAISDAAALALADYVQIASELPTESSSYWTAGKKQGDGTCTLQQCTNAFGTADSPKPARNAAILEAYEDRLSVQFTDPEVDVSAGETRPTAPFAKCCFPSELQYNIRAGGQWIAIGDVTGFMHHVVAGPETGVCRNSCDPRFARLNGRVRHVPTNGPVVDGSPFAFQNPMFRFAITGGTPATGMQFRFFTQGSFSPLIVPLSTSSEVQPQSIRFIPSTGELAVADGYLEGLILLSSSGTSVSRQFF